MEKIITITILMTFLPYLSFASSVERDRSDYFDTSIEQKRSRNLSNRSNSLKSMSELRCSNESYKELKNIKDKREYQGRFQDFDRFDLNFHI